MRYVLAIILPPLAVFSCGKILQGFINIILTLLGWVPGVVHAALIVNDYKGEQRTNRIVDAIRSARMA
ncbi:MAG: YqaE/Pmp3 family membrane protein [Phycisphaerales bacterium]